MYVFNYEMYKWNSLFPNTHTYIWKNDEADFMREGGVVKTT